MSAPVCVIPWCFERTRDAEIHDVDAAILVGHHILGFQVAVHDSRGMRGFESRGDLQDDGNGFVGGELPFFVDQALEVTSLDILHGDELDALRLPEIENADDVAMGDFAREDQFLLEPAKDFGMAGELGTNQFERDQALEFAYPEPCKPRPCRLGRAAGEFRSARRASSRFQLPFRRGFAGRPRRNGDGPGLRSADAGGAHSRGRNGHVGQRQRGAALRAVIRGGRVIGLTERALHWAGGLGHQNNPIMICRRINAR